MAKEIITILKSQAQPEVNEMMAFLNTLDQNRKRSLLDFLQGAKFMQNLMVADGRATTSQRETGSESAPRSA